MITVTVVLYRATAIVFYSFKSLGHLHLHTETEHMRNFSLRIGSHLLSHLYSTLVVDYISKIQFGRNILHFVFCTYHCLIVYCLPFEGSQLQTRVLPGSEFLLQTCTEIIVRRCTPEVRCQFGIFVHQFRACYVVAIQVTGMFVEFQTEVITVDDQITPVVFLDLRSNGRSIHNFYILQVHSRSLVGVQYKLVFGYGISGREQTFAVLQAISYIQQPFFAFAGFADVQFHSGSLLRSYVEVFYTTGTNYFTVSKQLPIQIVSGKVTEEVFVVHVHFAVLQVSRSCPDVLIIVTHFVHVRIGNTVGTDQTIIAEVLVVTVEVTAISVDSYTVFAFPTNGLVYKVPDETALQVGVFTDQIPIFFETAL